MNDILDTARQDYIARNYTAAQAKYRQVLQSEPNNLRALQGEAFCLVVQGKNDEALAICERGLQLDPNESAFYKACGWVYLRTKQYDPSEIQFRRALELDPNDWVTMKNMAIVYAYKSNLKTALEWANHAYRMHPSLTARLIIYEVVRIRFNNLLGIILPFCFVVSLLFQSWLTLPFILVFEIAFGLDILASYLSGNGKIFPRLLILLGALFYYLFWRFSRIGIPFP